MAQSTEPSTLKPVVLKAPPEEGTNGVYPISEAPDVAKEAPASLEPPPPTLEPPSQEILRRTGWDMGVRKAGDWYTPSHNHVALGMVNPFSGFAHWRILQKWIDDTAWSRGEAWFHCRLILRLYDVSFITFNGFNAHRIQDVTLPGIAGNLFFNLPRPGTYQLGEVGFLLRGGEFVPAARSQVTAFAGDAVSPRHDHSALLVDDKLHVEEVGNLWEQDRVLQERRKPKIRPNLRLAAFAFETPVSGQESLVAHFAAQLAAQEASLGHDVHLFVPASPQLNEPAVRDGVHYHPLKVRPNGSPIERALSYARSAEVETRDLPPFDLYHMHEWLTGLAPWVGSRPTVLSLTSIESSRLNGAEPSEQSREIMKIERELAHGVECILTPDWLRSRAIHDFGIDSSVVHAFPMEARLPDEWECPTDYGDVKRSIGFGPLDQVLLFIGPLEHASGADILIEALPTLLGRCPRVRLAFAGEGGMHGHLEWLAGHMGVGYCVRVLGHVPRDMVVRLMRAAEALVLPSRYRVAQDDAVVDLARRAGRPVVTTNNGPCYLVRHEENGIVAFDNTNSMVWALERILRDPGHAWKMGQAGKRSESTSVSWAEVARRYLELCALSFPELAEPRI